MIPSASAFENPSVLAVPPIDTMSTKPTFWNQLRQTQPDLPLMALAGLLATIAIVAWRFGYEHPPLAPSLLLEVLLAAMLLGGLGGFLFGLPKLVYITDTVQPAVGGGAADGAAPAPAALASAPVPVIRNSSGSYTPGTNLDEVASWLTKIIIGATLVEIKQIGGVIAKIAGFIVAPCAPGCGQFARPFVASLIIAAFVAGFLFGYLWTRLHYARIAATADRRVIEIVNKQTGEITQVMTETKVVKASVATLSAILPHDRAMSDPASSDPNRGRFGGSPGAGGRELSARFSKSRLRGFTQVELHVRSVGDRPLTGVVKFYLHPTFMQPIVNVPVVDGVASLKFDAWGAFTVGVEADAGETRLELDLAEEAAAPEEFRLR